MKIYSKQPEVKSIGKNLIITDSNQVKNNNMFLRINPEKTTLFDKLQSEVGMSLIKTSGNSLTFRTNEALKCGELGQNHLDLNLRYNQFKDQVTTDLGLFRLVCLNGMTNFESMGSITYNKVMKNKIDVDDLIRRIIPKVNKVEKRLDKYQSIELSNELKQEFRQDFINRMSMDSTLGYLAQYDKMSVRDMRNFIKLIPEVDLLEVNRVEDSGNNLWLTYNTVQENVLKLKRNLTGNNGSIVENKILLDTLHNFVN